MRKLIFFCALFSLLAGSVSAQKKWTELSKKDSEKLLNSSAWGQTQVETDTSEMTFTPTTATGGNGSNNANRNPNASSTGSTRSEQGANNGPVSIYYRIRFLSAKPIREAYAAMLVQLNPPERKQALIPAMQEFVDREMGDYIVIAVAVEGTDRRFSGPVEQSLASSTGETLKNDTYLERKDGKRLFLLDYRPPGKDGLGAKFVFARTVEGKDFLSTGSESVRFVAEMPSSKKDKPIKMNMKFKISDMMYNGKLEY